MKSPLLFLIVAGALAASHAGARAADADACSIVSFAEAGKALDAPVSSVKTRPHGEAITCVFRAATGYKRLDVSMLPFASVAESKAEFHAMVTDRDLQLAPSEDLPGIGDEAHRFGPMVYVRKNATVYTFAQIAADPNGDGVRRTIALAKASVGRASDGHTVR